MPQLMMQGRSVPRWPLVVGSNREKQSTALLKHEQMHYDIAAIAARELEKRLWRLKGDRSRSLDEAYESLNTGSWAKMYPADRPGLVACWAMCRTATTATRTCGSNHGVARHHQITWEHRIIRAHGSKSGTLEQLDSCPRPRAAAAGSGE